jgi:alanyl-tRNA synthetase
LISTTATASPSTLTQLLATERGLTVDSAGFESEMEKQRERGRAAQKKEIIVAATEGDAAVDQKPTTFLGYRQTTARVRLIEVVKSGKDAFLVFDQTPFYAEMGGQAGDSGTVSLDGKLLHIVDTVKDKSGRHLHKLRAGEDASPGSKPEAELSVDLVRRRAISRHHLRRTSHPLGRYVRSSAATSARPAPPRRRTGCASISPISRPSRHAQLLEIEQLVNDRVIDNAEGRNLRDRIRQEARGHARLLWRQYGKIVRVVDMGGYSRELCGGTHVSTTGEIGVIKIVAEMAVAAGTRRIEAVAGQASLDFIAQREAALAAVSAQPSAGPTRRRQETRIAPQSPKELERKLKSFEQKASAGLTDQLLAKAVERDGLKFVTAVVTTEAPESLRALGSQISAKLGEGVVTLGANFGDKATVVAFCSPGAIKAGHAAGKIVQELCVKLGGKGGGKPDFAMGGGKDTAKLAELAGRLNRAARRRSRGLNFPPDQPRLERLWPTSSPKRCT